MTHGKKKGNRRNRRKKNQDKNKNEKNEGEYRKKDDGNKEPKNEQSESDSSGSSESEDMDTSQQNIAAQSKDGDTEMIDTSSNRTVIYNAPSYEPGSGGPQPLRQKPIQKPPQKIIDKYQMHALWEPKSGNTSANLQLMIHKIDMKSKFFHDFTREEHKIGNKNFTIFTTEYKVRDGYHEKYQPCVLDHVRLIGKRKYYEEFNTFRNLKKDTCNQFIFGLLILENTKYKVYSKPDGVSIVDPLMELLYFSSYLLVTDQLEAFPDLYQQFLDRYPQQSYLAENRIKSFSIHFDDLVHDRETNLSASLIHIFAILGVFTTKMSNIKCFQIHTCSLILQKGQAALLETLLLSQYDDTLFNDDALKANKTLAGYTLAMLINFVDGKLDWHQSLAQIMTDCPREFFIVIQQFLKRLQANDIKLQGHTITEIKGMIDIALDTFEIEQNDLEIIYMLLLEQPSNFRSLADVLQTLLPEQSSMEQKKDIEFNKKTQSKIVQIINKFQQYYFRDLIDIQIYLEILKPLSPQVKQLFYQSDAPKQIKGIFQNKHYQVEQDRYIPQLKSIFLDNSDDLILSEVKFEDIISNVLIQNSNGFKEVYKQLLMPKKNSELTKGQIKRYVKTRFGSNQQDIDSLIKHFDELLQDLSKSQNVIQNGQESFEFFYEVLAEEINIKCNSTHKSILDPFIFTRLNFCAFKPFINALVNFIKEIVIRPNIKQPYQNPLLKILSAKEQFIKDKKESKLVDELIDFSFKLSNDRPTEDRVRKQLIEDPSTDHVWYKLIDGYRYYSQQDEARHLLKMISQLADQIEEESLTIGEVLKVKNLDKFKRGVLILYLQKALSCLPELEKKAKNVSQNIDEMVMNVTNTLQQIDELRTFIANFLNQDKRSSLYKKFEQHIAGLNEQTVQELSDFPPVLQKYLQIAKKMYILQHSVIFEVYLNTAKENMILLQGPLEASKKKNLVLSCDSAYNLLIADIELLSSEDLSEFPVYKIRNMLGNETLNEAQTNKEIEIFRKIVNQELPSNPLKVLRNILLSFCMKRDIEMICQGLINVQELKYTKREQTQQQQLPVFNFNMDYEIRIAKNFVKVCITDFDKESINNYYDAFDNARDNLFCKIERIVGNNYQYQQHQVSHSVPAGVQMQMEKSHQYTAKAVEPSKESASVIKVLKSFSDQSESLIQFLRMSSNEDLDHLKEYVNDYDDSGVSTQTILDCIAIWEYIHTLVNTYTYASYSCNFEKFIEFILLNNQVQKFKEIDAKISSCVMQLISIKDLKNTLDSQEEAKKKQILEVMRLSDFKFSLDKQNEWILELFYVKNGQRKNFNCEIVNELRDRALLIQHTQSQSIKGDEITEEERIRQMDEQRLMGKFIDFANLIKSTITNLTLLQKNGYPSNSDDFDLRKFQCQDASFEEFKQFEAHVINTQNEWNDCLIRAYKQSYWLTFISGPNLWIVEQYLIAAEQKKSDMRKARNLLIYMGKINDRINLEEYFIVEDDEIDEEMTPQRRINRLISLLEIIPSCQINYDAMKSDVGESKISKRKGEIFYLETQQPFVGVISMYINSDRKFPRADQLFFCHGHTTWQELQCFFYRFLTNKKKELYLIIQPEQLSLDNQDKMTAILQKFMKEEMQFEEFDFGIITNQADSHVSSFFRQQEYTKIVKEQFLLNDNKLKQIIGNVDKNTLFVRSAAAGLGKTHFIKVKAQREKRHLVIFPIAGTINFTEIGHRLQKLKVNKMTLLAFHISFVDKIDLLNELLINIALFRIFQSPTNIFILSTEYQVCIELSNTYDNTFENQIFYRKYVREHYIQEFDIRTIEVKTEDNDTQFVCNNLSQYEQTSLRNTEEFVETPDKLSKDECIKLLTKYFVQSQVENDQDPNFIQLSIFQRILSTLFQNFSICGFFSPDMIPIIFQDMRQIGLSNIVDQLGDIRQTIIKAILMTVNEFTLKSINRGVRNNQNSTNTAIMSQPVRNARQRNFEEGKKEGAADDNKIEKIEQEFKIKLSWETSNHFNAIFVQDGSVIFIYRDPAMVPEAMRKLIYVQSNFGMQGEQINQNIAKGDYRIMNYNDLEHYELRDKLMVFRTHLVKTISQGQDSYVLTTDNFLKMCIIYLKIQSKVPVIIMGETGCGKTSLIKYFCTDIRGDELQIFNIHAGVSYQKIIEEMKRFIHIANTLTYKNLWVFFDEFNTTENLGLICEVLTENTLLGEKLPQNMCFLAACNPYRLRSKKIRFDENVGIKRANDASRLAQSMLLYTVHPLPDNIIEYVWDFGALTDDDYEKYIHQMLLNAHVKDENMLTQMLIQCHKYFNNNEDSSSVSLRDVSRFIILYDFFNKSLNDKKQLADQFDYGEKYRSNVKQYRIQVEDYRFMKDIEFRAAILALTHCYYLRLANMQDRHNFLYQICNAQRVDRNLNVGQILDIISCEQNDYLARMELPEGTAVNLALKENIFAMIPCIINKIPVFICGKPGCSKSLAIIQIFQNLRGSKSQDYYYKTLPELTQVSFQGSDSCTSDGIITAYERARKYLNNDSNLLPVFVFDEIGLAELSRHNPLKVLHSLLEVENRTIGFIGISNWRLDASKMNRALYLARPDPDEEDLKSTAICIYQQICPQLKSHEMMINDLASSYFELKKHYKEREPEYADFYGLRDFYHLIKQISRKLKNCDSTDKIEIIRIVKIAIQRNFGGKLEGFEKLGELFAAKQQIQDEYTHIPNEKVLDLVSMNINEQDSRYLMLICKSEVATCLLQRQFKNQPQFRRTLVGSKLEHDLQKEEYGFRSLADVILYIEKGIHIILKDMDHIYSSLYDLFNQHFSVLGEKKYCRIALGDKLNPKCQVHEDFRCIVFMSESDEKLLKADAPFLNRFEKHFLQLDQILSPKQQEIVIRLQEWVQSLLDLRYIRGEIQLHPTSVFPNYNQDTLGLIVLSDESDDPIDVIVMRCKETLIHFATLDIIVLSKIAKISKEESDFIADTYRKINSTSFNQRLLEFMQQGTEEESSLMEPRSQINKLIAFTYSKYLFLDTNKLPESINVRSISNFKSEQELVQHLEHFFLSEEEHIFILQVNYSSDKDHMSFVKFIIEKVESEMSGRIPNKQTKSIVLLIYMQRNFNEEDESSLPLFEGGWEQKMFYDISDSPFELTEELLTSNLKDLFRDDKHIDFPSLLGSLTEKCLLKLQFDGVVSMDDRDDINENLFFIIKWITEDKELVEAFKAKIYKYIIGEQRALDWKLEICSNVDICIDSHNVETAFKGVIEESIEKFLTVLLYQLEKNSAFRSYFTDSQQPHGAKLKEIWFHFFNSINLQAIQLQNLSQSNYTVYFSNLKFPFSRMETDVLREICLEQRLFESGDHLVSPIEHFAEQFNEKSKLGKHVETLVDDDDVQRVYLDDILKIFLIDNLLKPDYEKIIQLILKKIIASREDNFYSKLYTFLMKQQLFISVCVIIDIHSEIKADSSLNTISAVFEDALNEFQDQTWETMTGELLDDLILDCYPTQNGIQNLQSVERMSVLLEKLYGVFASLGSAIHLENLPILKFWCDLTQLCASKGGMHSHFLIQASNKAQKIDDSGNQFLQDDGFVQYILNFFQDQNDSKFIASFFATLIDMDPMKISFIAMKFEKQENDNLHRHCSSVFQRIMKHSGVMTQIEDNEKQLQPDDQSQTIEFEQNDYLDCLEGAVQQVGIKSKFSIALGDIVQRELLNQVECDVNLELQFLQFSFYLRAFENLDRDEQQQYVFVKKIVALAIIKNYLDIYTDVIHKIEFASDEEHKAHDIYAEEQEVEIFELSGEARNILREVDHILCSHSLKSTLQLYCMKRLRVKFQFSSQQLKNYMVDKLSEKYAWVRENELVSLGDRNQELELDAFPMIERLLDGENLIIGLIESVMRSNSQNSKALLKQKIQDIRSTDDRIQIGLAFLKACFFKFYSNPNALSPNIEIFFKEELEEILEVRLGQPYSSLIGCFITNFPRQNMLRMENEADQSKTHKNVISCFILIIVLSFADQGNPISGVFFRNGGFNPNNIVQSFLVGMEVNHKHFYLQDMLTSFDTYRNTNGMGTYVCGNGCDFVYIVYDCAQQMHNSTCPWCRQPIGGQNHVAVARAGHQQLPDAQARAYLQNLVTKYEATQQTGYINVNTTNQDPSMTSNGIRSQTWRLLRTLIHLPMYYLMSSNQNALDTVLSPRDLQTINMRPKQFLEQHIQNDLTVLFQQLSSAGNDCQASWLYSVLSELPQHLDQFRNTLPVTLASRIQFEKHIDTNLMQGNIANIGTASQAFKQKILQNKGQGQSKFDMLVQELEQDSENYPYQQYFRLTRTFSFQDMQVSFRNNPQNLQDFKILRICLDNIDKLEKLKKLHPVIEFTSYMLQKFNHMLKREDARSVKIKECFQDEEDGEHVKHLYSRFENAWNSIGFEGKIQYTCKQLEYLIYQDSSNLINFLIDNKEPGGGMCMAAGLSELGEIHNKILGDLINTYCRDKNLKVEYAIDTFQHPIQKVKPTHILALQVDDMNLIRISSLNNLTYGRGQEIVYDYARIEANLVKEILKRKFIRTDTLEFIQYQLELMTKQGDKSALITEIRKKVPQKPFVKEDQIRINQYFEIILQRNEAEVVQTLRKLHGGLEKILCFLLNANEQGTTSIQEFCLKISQTHIEKPYRERTILSQVQLTNITALYEQIERVYFPFITSFLRPEFFIETNKEEIKENLRGFLELTERRDQAGELLIPSRQAIQNALLRFMIRCLAGELDPKEPLYIYLVSREDVWDEDVPQTQRDNFEDKFPVTVKLESIFCVYNLVDELNRRSEKTQLGISTNQKKEVKKVVRPKAPVKRRQEEGYI